MGIFTKWLKLTTGTPSRLAKIRRKVGGPGQNFPREFGYSFKIQEERNPRTGRIYHALYTRRKK